MRNLEAGLPWHVDTEATELAIMVIGGVVALSGCVRCRMGQPKAAENPLRTADAPGGFLEVLVPLAFRRADIEIACGAAAAVRREVPASCEYAQLQIKDGQVTLDGRLEWNYQRERIEDAIREVVGVNEICNRTSVSSHVDLAAIRDRLKEAQRCSAESESQRPSDAALDDCKALKGTLRSWALRDQGQRTA